MAQLSDDCFAFGGALLSVEAAEALIAERVPPLAGEETVPLAAALGRVLARDLVAPLPLPPFFNAAVDGYAFRHADLAADGETRLTLSGRLAAGQATTEDGLGRGDGDARLHRRAHAARRRHGADAGGCAAGTRRRRARRAARPQARRQRAAGRARTSPRGALALPAGRRLRAPEIGLAAALGLTALPVRRRVRVGVFSTGDELASPGEPLRAAQTYDSNRFTLLALLAGLPVEATDLGILPDRPEAVAAALRRAAASHDMLLSSGGVSTGEEDHVRAAIEGSGSLVFWRLAIKPGRPAAMGVVGGVPVVGLPGNPVAAVVTFLHLARPLVLRLAGAAPEPLPRFAARAAFAYRKKGGRREYVRVRLAPGTPLPEAAKFAREGAGLLSSLTESDAFAELPEEVTAVAPGDIVQVLPFAAVF